MNLLNRNGVLLVLLTLLSATFELQKEAKFSGLSLKTALLTVLSSIKMGVGLQALSVTSTCLKV